MTNFDFLRDMPDCKAFADVAVSSEKLYNFDLGACVINCRRTLECAVKWMYSVDEGLKLPYQDTLVSFISTEEFRDLVGTDILRRINFIRKLANETAHSSSRSLPGKSVCLYRLYRSLLYKRIRSAQV